MITLLSLAFLNGCSSSSYATKEDLARLEGRVQTLEQRGGMGGQGGGMGGMGGQGGGMGGQGGGMGGQGGGMGGQGAGMGGQGAGMGGMGGEGGMQGGQGGGMGGAGGMGGPGGEGGMQGGQGGGEGGAGQLSPDAQEMEKAMAEGMDAMNKGDIATAKAKLSEVTTKYPDQKATEMAKQILAELEIIGAAAPALTTESWLQGTGDLTSGKATLVVFFTTENKNAETAMGKVQALSMGAKSRGLNVVGITSATETMNAQKLKDWLSTKGVTFAVGLDKAKATATAYKRSAPISAVLVKSGKVVWTGNASRMSDDILNKYL